MAGMSGDTIFALSSGRPPAAIAVLRISGPSATHVLTALAGGPVPPRRAVLRTLRDAQGDVLDRGLVLYFPGPASATGEDSVELHLHGGRAVVAAVEQTLAALPGFRAALPGEFTRRAFANGCLDLSEAGGLADLLEAETELQRRNAQAIAAGGLSQQVSEWREAILMLGAEIEAILDFSDEEDGAALSDTFHVKRDRLLEELRNWTAAPRVETLRDGYRVVIAGPPNSGKSSLFNAILKEEAAIATPIAGTTRDTLLRPVSLDGIPFHFVDTAGLRDDAHDEIEQIGIGRARAELSKADLVLWLGEEGLGPPSAWEISAKSDRADMARKKSPVVAVSARTGEGIETLVRLLVERARQSMSMPGMLAISQFQRAQIVTTMDAIVEASVQSDPLLIAEGLRQARSALDALVGRSDVEAMLDRLFARFCIGK